MGGGLAVDQRPASQPVAAGDEPGVLLLPLVRGSSTTPQSGGHTDSGGTTMGRPRPQHGQFELLIRSAGTPRKAGWHGEPSEKERREVPLEHASRDLVENQQGEQRTAPDLEEAVEVSSDTGEKELAFKPRWSELEKREASEEKDAGAERRDFNIWEVKACLPESYEESLLQAPNQEEEDSWSLNSLIRPARKALDWLRSPRKRPAEDPVFLRGEQERKDKRARKPLEGRRRDLLEVRESKPTGRRKDMRLKAARAAGSAKGKKYSIEKDFFSKNGEAPRRSRRKTVERMLKAATCFRGGQLSVDIMKTLSSALKEAGYKSGLNYLIEAKMWHLEVGDLWDSQLDRTFKLCKAGLERGKGPKKKAPEGKKEVREFTKELLVRAATCSVKFPHLLFMFGMVWMLREIEIAAISTGDFLVNHLEKRVSLLWKSSKKDQEGLRIKRTLQCLCEGECAVECPFKVTLDLIKAVESFNGSDSAIALTRRRMAPSKDQMTKAWSRTFGQKVGGHSARRTGALSYIRAGWDVGQVAYLGRWNSNIILEYAREALEEVPVNKQTVAKATDLYPARCLEKEETLVSLLDTQAKTQQEIKRMKSDVKAVKEKVEDTVQQLEKWAEAGDNLPERVQSTHSKVVHANQATLAVSPPFSWRTKCGWHFHFSHYVFVKASMEVTCVKCKAAQ